MAIYDDDEELVPSFSSVTGPKDPEEPPFVAEYWIGHPQELSKAAGMHRFVWNLRYPDPRAMHPQAPHNYPIAAIVGSTPRPPQRPLVLRERYEARLKPGGRRVRQPPRLQLPSRSAGARDHLQRQPGPQWQKSRLLGKS